MLDIVSLISVTVGAVAAYLGERLPKHAEAIETGAGFLLIGGLSLLGSALPIIL
jgi:hypothetical protein